MKVMMMAALALMAATGVQAEQQLTQKSAQQYQCTLGQQQRQIEVRYPQGKPLPCEVVYHKQGQSQVLWSAQHTQGYCADKAAAFAEKQRSWDWQCQLKAE